VSTLQAGVPDGTRLVLRGSAVVGSSYVTGEPFDARGPGSSDLDVVLLGEAAMAEWDPGAFYLPGVNTQPLWNGAPDIAVPRLEVAPCGAGRRGAACRDPGDGALVPRAARLQSTPYVILGG
jgi:hypothetical protein